MYTPEHQDEQFEHHLCHAQCGNFRIFLPIRFYVKTILADFRSSKISVLAILRALNFVNLVDFIQSSKSEKMHYI